MSIHYVELTEKPALAL